MLVAQMVRRRHLPNTRSGAERLDRDEGSHLDRVLRTRAVSHIADYAAELSALHAPPVT